MPLNPEDMDKAEADALWLDREAHDWRVMEGDSKDESELIEELGEWFTGIIETIDHDAGDYEGSRLYHLRHENFDRPILLWGKADIDRKVDNANLQTGDQIAIAFDGTTEVEASDGEMREMQLYNVRYDKFD